MTTPPSQRELEDVAARIADDEAIDWRLLARLDARSHDAGAGLHELADLAQAFRSVQIHALAPESQSLQFRFAGLEVLEKLGEGSQGEVWRARDPLLDQQVALKLRKLDSGVLAHQFLREGRQLARVRHANVVSVYGAAIENGRAGLWMELVRGESLHQLLRGNGPLPPDEVIGIGLSLSRALVAVHRDGLVHGDIKAANVLRDDAGRIVLTDFGAARDWRDSGGEMVVSGTLAYLAPEVLEGGAATPSSDLYALGVLLYYLCCGQLPVEAPDIPALLTRLHTGTRPRLRDVCTHVPARFAKLIESALALDPSRRPASAQAFAQALADLADPPRRVGGLTALALGLALLACSAGGVALWQQRSPALANVEASLQRLGESAPQTLIDGSSVSMGDRLALSLNTSQPLWVYVFDDDGSGTAALLFPLDAQVANPVQPGQEVWLPGRGLSWQVDRSAAMDEFLVVAAPRPLLKIEQLAAEWVRPQASAGVARGMLTLATAPQAAELRSSQLREALLAAAAESEVRVWHWQLASAPR
jgi:hypothetical protein